MSLWQLFEQLQPLLHLPDRASIYYAEYVLRALAAQLYCRDEWRHLCLLRFVAHRY